MPIEDVTIAAVRNVQIDFYLTKPRYQTNKRCILTGKLLYQLPIVRIFGPTVFLRISTDLNKNVLTESSTLSTQGADSLLHIQNVFPYFYAKLNSALEAEVPQHLCPRCDPDSAIDLVDGVIRQTKQDLPCCKFAEKMLRQIDNMLKQHEAYRNQATQSNMNFDDFSLIADIGVSLQC